MSIESELARFAKTQRFKDLCKQAQKEAVAEGRSFGTGGSASPEKLATIGAEARQTFHEYISAVIPSIGIQDIIVGDVTPLPDGTFEIPLYFDPDAIERESLWVEKWGEVDNIIRLLTHGWDTKGKIVTGMWHGRVTESWPKRAGDQFLQNAADKIMADNPGVTVILHDKYIDRYW